MRHREKATDLIDAYREMQGHNGRLLASGGGESHVVERGCAVVLKQLRVGLALQKILLLSRQKDDRSWCA